MSLTFHSCYILNTDFLTSDTQQCVADNKELKLTFSYCFRTMVVT